jgi:hypothetical protein
MYKIILLAASFVSDNFIGCYVSDNFIGCYVSENFIG